MPAFVTSLSICASFRDKLSYFATIFSKDFTNILFTSMMTNNSKLWSNTFFKCIVLWHAIINMNF